jgi:flagellar hook-associated protein 2
MGTITSGIGLVSGLDTGAIIDELVSLDSAPVTLLQNRISSNTAQQQAYSALETQLTTLQTVGLTLQRPTTFLASTTTSSDPNVLTATTTAGAPQGSYQFQVAQLVSSQQSVSGGYTSTSAPMQAGTMTFEMGGGSLATQTPLADLNGGSGVSRGQFRITDRSGKTDVIDTSSAVTLDDVVKQINTALDVSVHASIQNDHLVLSDTSNGSGNLSVQDLAGGSSAQNLGIAQTVSASTLTGSSISYLTSNSALSSLNDGRGVRSVPSSNDFTITASDGTASAVSVGTSQTVGDVIKAINTATGGKVVASIAPGASGITLTDTSGGLGAFSVTSLNNSNAASDLGILKTGSAGVITGNPTIAGLDTVMIGSLNGGSGIPMGQISVTDRSGANTTIDLSGAKTVQNILDTINNTTGVHVTASLNAAGNGIQIQDSSGGTGNLVIANANGGTTAAGLGIAGTFNASQTTVNGGDLHIQYVTQNTLLSKYNGGKGVSSGSFTITNAAGQAATIDTTKGTFNTIGDVLSTINGQGIGVTASINTTGNGILLTDNSTGGGHLTVTGVTGTTAKDLNIAGAATANTIDGAEEKSIQVTSTDTLSTVQAKIQAMGFGVAANIINDGSSQTPFRLSVTALNTGTAGQVLIDSGTTGLQIRNLVAAQDSAVFVGGVGSSQPLLVTSSTNQLSNVIPGVTISLQSASSTPVTLSITRDGSGIQTQLQTFTDTFNTLVDQLNTLTQYNTSTNQGGILLGDPTAQRIQEQMYSIFSGVVSSAGEFRTLGDVGITLTDGAKVQFDSSVFSAAFAKDPDAVNQLFTTATTGLATVLNNSMTSLVDPVTGAIAQENQTLTNTNQTFQDQITQLDAVLANKRAMLQEQFNNMETVLANLQSQQSALSTITGIKPTTNTSSAATTTSSPSTSTATTSSTTTPSTTTSSTGTGTGTSSTSTSTGTTGSSTTGTTGP